MTKGTNKTLFHKSKAEGYKMKNVSLKLVTLAVVALSAVSTVSALENKPTKAELSVDKNQISFGKYDTDNNGKLTENEILAANNGLLNKAFKTLDSNGDSSISLEEFSKFTAKK